MFGEVVALAVEVVPAEESRDDTSERGQTELLCSLSSAPLLIAAQVGDYGTQSSTDPVSSSSL